ncbi:T9SS type A sorting domain-containing protein [Hymenobacter sp. HMF4947]|uniref:T9SS type A sorting domain-containing protein n=1 Tax=Hymenobacter ginkgonis TaxID=2682976 RepID=A0A7K1TCP6_9BACT|nr:T9SS type A sorting domain-containing protein [Hymenobacter ginkgonis]MVN75961.1 T9SS type A sorting domain-containing protein [Hymenobacter ginkgonis]
MANSTFFSRFFPAVRIPSVGMWSLACLTLLAARPSQAQDVSRYQFAATSGTFTPLVGGTAVSNLSANDAISANITLPFTFTYGGKAYTTLQATTDGYIDFRGSSTYSQSINTLGAGLTTVAPFYDDLTGVNGTASYAVSGTSPNRVFTFEWLNWGIGFNATAANLSFQVKLYEGTNVLQFVYRPEAGAVGTTPSASIGIDGGTTTAGTRGNFVSLSDASASPTLVNNATAALPVNTISTRPAAGQVYTFTPAATLATRTAFGASQLELFPNPAAGAFTLRLPALAAERTAQVALFNSLGQLLQSRSLDLAPAGTQTQVDVSALAAGLYTLRVQAGSQVATQQVAVK